MWKYYGVCVEMGECHFLLVPFFEKNRGKKGIKRQFCALFCHKKRLLGHKQHLFKIKNYRTCLSATLRTLLSS